MWYRFAAEQGLAQAQSKLSHAFRTGQGVPQDYDEAAVWYRLSADQGLAGAQNDLSIIYYMGYGVPEDLVLAHMWISLAANQGYKQAIGNRAKVAEQMNPAEIAEAERLAREWLPKR